MLRFVCTKNYAEWRTGKLDSKHGHYTQIVQVILYSYNNKNLKYIRCIEYIENNFIFAK